MKKAIKTQGLLKFTTKGFEHHFDDFDLSSLAIVTDGTPSQFCHNATGYGFIAGEGEEIKGKTFHDYESINPWYIDLIAFCQRQGIRDVVYVANVITEVFAGNRTPVLNFHHSDDIDLYAIELGNEPYMKPYDLSFYQWLKGVTQYFENHSFAPLSAPIENNINGRYSDNIIDLSKDEPIAKISLHKYFNPYALTNELREFKDHIEALRENTDLPIMLTETNIHGSFLGDGGISKDAMWNAWSQMYDTFEEVGLDLVCHHNLAAIGDKYSLFDKHGPRCKSDGTPLINFFL